MEEEGMNSENDQSSSEKDVNSSSVSIDTAETSILRSSFSYETDLKEEEIMDLSTNFLRRRREYFPPAKRELPLRVEYTAQEQRNLCFGMLRHVVLQRRHFMFGIFALFVLGSVSYSLGQQRWRDINIGRLPPRRKAQRIVQKIENHVPRKSYTIRLTGDRIDLLHQSLDHHAYCLGVSHVQIHWNGNELPESLLNHNSGIVEATDKLSTDAVLLLDAGIHFSCKELQRAFHQWRADPARLVGFFPLRERESYSLVSDRAVFVHRLYLDQTTTKGSSSKCQHLVLSARVSTMSTKHPVAVAAKPHLIAQPKDVGGLECVPLLTKVIGMQSLPKAKTAYVGRQ